MGWINNLPPCTHWSITFRPRIFIHESRDHRTVFAPVRRVRRFQKNELFVVRTFRPMWTVRTVRCSHNMNCSHCSLFALFEQFTRYAVRTVRTGLFAVRWSLHESLFMSHTMISYLPNNHWSVLIDGTWCWLVEFGKILKIIIFENNYGFSQSVDKSEN